MNDNKYILEDNTVDLSLIKLESLESEYQLTLNEYEQTFKTYINYLQNNEKTGDSNYTLLTANGASDTYCRGDGWDEGGWPLQTGFYPNDQCANLCNENPYCTGYDLTSTTDTNGNNLCSLYKNTNLIAVEGNNSKGCFKKKYYNPPTSTTSTNNYGLLGIGVDGYNYYKPSLNDPWQLLDNETPGGLIACAINPINNNFYVINNQNIAYYKNSYSDSTFSEIPNSCCITDLAISPDGQYIVVIDKNGKLWSGTMDNFMNGISNSITSASNPTENEYATAIAIDPDGQVYHIGGGGVLFQKANYLALSSETWLGPLTNSCCIISITFAPDGTMFGMGTDYLIYTKSPDNNYTNPWTITLTSEAIQVMSIAVIPSFANISAQTQNINTNNKSLAEFNVLQGKNYWGTAPLKEGNVSSLQECESMCASDLNCTGATFESDKNYCYTRTGESDIVTGASSDYALIPQLRQSLMILKNLNNKLMNINKQINTQMENLYPIAKQDYVKKNEKQKELNINYANLLKEQEQIELNLKEYETLDQDFKNNSLTVNKNNLLLKFWTIFALVLLAITFKVVFNIKGSSFIFLFITVLLIIVFLSLDWWSLLPIIILPLLFKLIYYPS